MSPKSKAFKIIVIRYFQARERDIFIFLGINGGIAIFSIIGWFLMVNSTPPMTPEEVIEDDSDSDGEMF